MKIFFYDENGMIVNSENINPLYDPLKCIISQEPPYFPKEGFYGRLYYENNSLIWRYIPIDSNKEITSQQLSEMLEQII